MKPPWRLRLGITAAATALLSGGGVVYASRSYGDSEGDCGPVPPLTAAMATPDSAGVQADLPADPPL